MSVRPLRFFMRVLTVVAAGLLLPGTIAFAHSFAPAVLDLHERDGGQFDVVWKLPGPESGSLAAIDGVVQPLLPPHCQRIQQSAPVNSSEEGPTYWRVDCGATGLRGAPLSITGIEGSRLDVIVRVIWRDGTITSRVLQSGANEWIVPARREGIDAGAPAPAVLYSYGRLGIEHILFGYDHLLFVLGLILLVHSWSSLIKTITAFTAAHSVALALAVFGVIHVPPAPVEALIAGSIVLVALELARPRDAPPTVTRRFPWAVAFAFGLLHGLGFAGALREIGLPPDQIPVSLLGFNLGVEAGQLMFVAALVVPLTLLRRMTRGWMPVRLITAYAIGAVATAWMLERIGRFWVFPS
jgi:hypothetical protein